ncbi:MAG: hypothetical protein LBJ87_08560 [bacterium]|nr:hypothetical protein [bacterium]
MDRLPANSSASAHLRAAKSAYEGLSEACRTGLDGRQERAAFLEASRALREWVRVSKLIRAKKHGTWIQPSGEERPLYRRLKTEYERFLGARAANKAYEQERADFREALAELRFHAVGVREGAREVAMRASELSRRFAVTSRAPVGDEDGDRGP